MGSRASTAARRRQRAASGLASINRASTATGAETGTSAQAPLGAGTESLGAGAGKPLRARARENLETYHHQCIVWVWGI